MATAYQINMLGKQWTFLVDGQAMERNRTVRTCINGTCTVVSSEGQGGAGPGFFRAQVNRFPTPTPQGSVPQTVVIVGFLGTSAKDARSIEGTYSVGSDTSRQGFSAPMVNLDESPMGAPKRKRSDPFGIAERLRSPAEMAARRLSMLVNPPGQLPTGSAMDQPFTIDRGVQNDGGGGLGNIGGTGFGQRPAGPGFSALNGDDSGGKGGLGNIGGAGFGQRPETPAFGALNGDDSGTTRGTKPPLRDQLEGVGTTPDPGFTVLNGYEGPEAPEAPSGYGGYTPEEGEQPAPGIGSNGFVTDPPVTEPPVEEESDPADVSMPEGNGVITDDEGGAFPADDASRQIVNGIIKDGTQSKKAKTIILGALVLGAGAIGAALILPNSKKKKPRRA